MIKGDLYPRILLGNRLIKQAAVKIASFQKRLGTLDENMMALVTSSKC